MLCVAASHFGAVYWVEPLVVSGAISGVPYAGPAPAVARWFEQAASVFNPGPFGVAVFFLISGFVIPFSLERLPPGRFLLARALRIYPTYVVALLIGVGAAGLMSVSSGMPFTLTALRVTANMLLIHPQLGQPSIDMINWTLAVELKFYLLMALCARWTGRPGMLAAVGAGCAALATVPALLTHGLLQAEARSLFDLAFLPFMLVGTLVRIHWRAGGPAGPLLRAGAVLLAAAAMGVWWGPLHPLWPRMWPSYAVALLVFGLAYAGRGRAQPNRIADWLADISYPLYAVHALAGYCVMGWVLQAGFPPAATIAAALATALLLAAMLHLTVERWSIGAGRRLRVSAPRPAGLVPVAATAHPAGPNPAPAGTTRQLRA